MATIVACSALRRVYRERLRAGVGGGLRFVYLSANRELMRARVAGRRDHFMPASLVDSQFATLEAPDGEPDVVVTPADADLDAEIPRLAAELKGSPALLVTTGSLAQRFALPPPAAPLLPFGAEGANLG